MKYLKQYNESHVEVSIVNEVIDEILNVISNDPFLLSKEIVLVDKTLVSQSNPSNGYFIKFRYQTMVVEVSKFPRNFYLYGKVRNINKNRFNSTIDEDKNDILYRSIRDASNRNSNLLYLLKEISIPKNELLERLIEFDIIRDGQVDLISLSSLYDFYDVKFSKIACIDFFSHHDIKYLD